ncbi:uncharacterized protein LOC121875174 [Homarus americanus]|uniref:uncharacterized protein LOC121875174 n=1 Tax=Homarus americanus TaxID=6706 RepID=UPI001C43E783|nr:uncharacterized protein LOC121875174 [Homarus americanus]
MDDPDTDMKLELGGEVEGIIRYHDPLLVPTPVLLARREVPTRYPQATINQLHRVTEETLVYRQHNQLSCQLPGAPKSTFLMVFSPDGSKVASTHGDHNIYVTEVKTGHCICTLGGHPRTPWCVAFHPASNEIIASGCLGGEVRVWDLKGGSEVWTTEKNTVIASLAFHPTDQVLVIATFNEIYFWDWYQPEPFAKICTSDEKEKVRYVKFDPLGHKLITGIANSHHDRPTQGSCRLGGSTGGPFLSRSELMEREQQLNHRYNQLSNQYLNLMSRYEALTSRAFSNVTRAASRIDRGTDPIEPPPATLGQQALLNQARQFARQVTEERRGNTQNQESSNGENSRGRSSWAPDGQLGRDTQASNELNLRLEEDYGLSAVRTLRQIISDDSASSSSLDSSSSATSGTSGVSERNTRLSLLWTSRLHRPGQDSDSAGEASSVHSLGDSGAQSGPGDHRAPMGGEEGVSGTRRSESSVTERRNYRGTDDRASDDEDTLSQGTPNLRSTGSQSERAGIHVDYFPCGTSVIHFGRCRLQRENRSETGLGRSQSSEVDGVSGDGGVRPDGTQDNSGPGSGGSSEVHSSGLDVTSQGNTVRDSQLRETDTRRSESPSEPQNNQRDLPPLPRIPPISPMPLTPPSDPNEDLAIPGPSGLSGMSSPLSPSLYPTSSTLDPQFGVQLLSRHIENMQRICVAHLEITRHTHEILRLQQIRSMLYDIQHQIHSLRMSVDQSMEDLSGPTPEISNPTSHRNGDTGEDDPQVPPPRLGPGVNPPSLRLMRHWSRTSPRCVARLQRGPFGTRTRSRHSHRSWMMSPSVFRRIPRRRSIHTRLHLPVLPTPLHGTNSSSGGAEGGRLSPTRSLAEPATPASTTGTGAVIGPLPTPPPDQGHSEEQPRDIIRIVSGNQYGTQHRTMLRHSFERLQERLRERQEALEQQERRLRGFLNVSSPTSSTSSVTSSASLDREEDPLSPLDSLPERYRRAGPPTTSLAYRIANMLADQVARHDLSSGTQENSTGSNRSGAPGYSPTRPLERSYNTNSLRFSLRPPSLFDRPYGRVPERWCNSNFDRLSRRGSDRLLGRHTDRLRGRNLGRSTDRSVDALYGRSADLYNPWSDLSPTPPPTPPGPSLATPPNLSQRNVTDPYSHDFNINSSPWNIQRLRQAFRNARRHIPVDLNPGNVRDPFHFPVGALRSRSVTAERILMREGFRRERRDRYRQILQRMADRLNSLVNQEQEHQHLHQQRRLEQQAADTPETEQDPATSPMDNHMLNLRLLVRLALHLIYQLLNFICNQNVSYEERPISRLPNPFRDEETGGAGDGERGDLPPQMALDLEPGLHNLTTLLETVRMASEELRNDSVGDGTGESTPTQESARPNTNVPRHMSDFVRSSGNNGPGESTPTQESTRPNTFEPRRLSNFLRRSGNDGPGESTPTQESTRPNTNVPRHMSDFVRSQGNNGPRESAPTQENIREYSEISRHLASIVRNCGSDRTGRELPMQESRRHIRFEPRRLRDFFRSPRQVYEALSRVQESTRPNTFEPRRMSDFLRRPGNDGPGVSTLSQESTRPITNVPRRLSDFLRRSGNLSQHQDTNGGFGRAGCLGFRSSSPRPQLVIPRITLSDPSGSESQVEEESSLSGPTPGPSHNDQADFSTRSVSGVPLRLLGRQYAVDRRSPDSEDSPGPLDGVQDGPSHPPEPPFPWRGHLAPYDIGLPRGPGSEMLFRPNLQRAPPDRAAEREADNFFSRPHFTPHFGASRTISGSGVTHRIQAWDFTHYRIPDISDGNANVVVGKCKIHNDASVDISSDGTMLAALVPQSQAMTLVGVYSLENCSFGQLLYSFIFAPNTICVSLSPMARHLVVGFASQMPRLVAHQNPKQVVAQIYKLCDNPMFHGRGQAGHLQYLRDVEVVSDHRHTSLNCIRWLPYPGQGLIYGTNKGQLNILR